MVDNSYSASTIGVAICINRHGPTPTIHHANDVFDAYRAMYYGKGTSVMSVYLWDKVEEVGGGFAGAILIRNTIDDGNYWNSLHIMDVILEKGKAMYGLTSTILLLVTPNDDEDTDDKTEVKKASQVLSQSTNVSGSLSQHNTWECTIGNNNTKHIMNIGKLIEDVECTMQSELERLYIQKTKTVMDTIWKQSEGPTQRKEHTRVLNEAVLAMAMSRKAQV